jgi:hypothetical protein
LVLDEELKRAELESSIERGKVVSNLNYYGGHICDGIYLIAMMFGLDPSGSISKFSQMSKLYTRFRMVGVNYGNDLEAFFLNSNDLSSKDFISKNSDGYKGKFSKYKM